MRGRRWLKPVILATQEEEMREIDGQSQPNIKKAGGVAQYSKKEKKKRL
jgi:hypothetical protein